MATKLTIFLGCMVAVVKAGVLSAPPIAYAPTAGFAVANPLAKSVTDYDPHPQYTYAYDVQDSITGDSKNQHETRNGDVVSGSYSLIEADGTRRVVEYTADPVNGFNAVVHREPAVVKAAAVPAVAPAFVQPPFGRFGFNPIAQAFAHHP